MRWSCSVSDVIRAPDCVFCSIVAGHADRSVVFEDATTMAFMDILPINPGHLVVVPKDHTVDLAGLPLSLGGDMMRTAMRCAAALRSGPLRTDGINLFLADGEAAGQEVFHAHLHVVPRIVGDGFTLSIDYDEPPARRVLDDHATIIANHLAATD